MAVDVNAELPLLILIAGIACALIAWLLGTFTHFLRGYRYRVSLSLIAFPLSGLMGFFSSLKFAVSVAGDWLSTRFAIGGFGYLVFGFLGCWTAVRVGGKLDRKHTLSVLYNLVEEHKKRDASR